MRRLAPDPAVPRRDALLRPETMAGVISQRLLDGVPVESCERVYVKYRVGDSLRVVYRYDGHYVAARTGKRDGIAAPEVGAALYPFPHDRKLTALAGLGHVSQRLLNTRVTTHLVAYAAEQSATAECRDEHGHVLAYAKVGRDDAERRGYDLLASQSAVRVPRVLAAVEGVLLLEALEGHRLDHLHAPALAGLGATLASLHAVNINGVRPRLTRLYPERLATAAEVIARARPDVADAADRLLQRLLERVEDSERAVVCVHGDANLRNALLLPVGEVALLDLEDVSYGPAAADLAQVLAGLIVARTPRAAGELLRGYGTPPDRAALRWYTAASLLARVALPAVSRYRPEVLARLRELLDAGAALVVPHKVAA
jgi:aminoglycoside phosphotransferase